MAKGLSDLQKDIIRIIREHGTLAPLPFKQICIYCDKPKIDFEGKALDLRLEPGRRWRDGRQGVYKAEIHPPMEEIHALEELTRLTEQHQNSGMVFMLEDARGFPPGFDTAPRVNYYRVKYDLLNRVLYPALWREYNSFSVVRDHGVNKKGKDAARVGISKSTTRLEKRGLALKIWGNGHWLYLTKKGEEIAGKLSANVPEIFPQH